MQGSAAALVGVPPQSRIWEYSRREGFTILENPAMDYNARARSTGYPYYLYYSGGDWQSSGYGTGIAACRTPLGPCGRVTADEPWLASRGSVSRPGGLSHFRIGAAHWVAYHSWKRGAPTGEGRRLHIEPLGYDGFTPVLLNSRPRATVAAEATAPEQAPLSAIADGASGGRPPGLDAPAGSGPTTTITTDTTGMTTTSVPSARYTGGSPTR